MNSCFVCFFNILMFKSDLSVRFSCIFLFNLKIAGVLRFTFVRSLVGHFR
jgi:hypothetical protein